MAIKADEKAISRPCLSSKFILDIINIYNVNVNKLLFYGFKQLKMALLFLFILKTKVSSNRLLLFLYKIAYSTAPPNNSPKAVSARVQRQSLL